MVIERENISDGSEDCAETSVLLSINVMFIEQENGKLLKKIFFSSFNFNTKTTNKTETVIKSNIAY